MESKSIRKILVFFISIPHFVFCILQECSFKSVKYELTHSEVWNINCNQCKYVRASAFSHFFLRIMICESQSAGKWAALSPTCRKKGKLGVHRIKAGGAMDFRGESCKNAIFLAFSPHRPNILPTYQETLILCWYWGGNNIQRKIRD